MQTHEIISTAYEIERLRAWIDRNSEAVFDHVIHAEPLPVGTTSKGLCEQLSDARKAVVELWISQLWTLAPSGSCRANLNS